MIYAHNKYHRSPETRVFHAYTRECHENKNTRFWATMQIHAYNTIEETMYFAPLFKFFLWMLVIFQHWAPSQPILQITLAAYSKVVVSAYCKSVRDMASYYQKQRIDTLSTGSHESIANNEL